MSILEATVEITKAAIGSGSSNNFTLLTYASSRAEFLKGIEELYKKLQELQEPKK